MNRPDGGRKALPARLLPYLQGVPAERDGVGCTGAEVLLLPDKVLKVERRSDESDRERAAYAWLAGRLPAYTACKDEMMDALVRAGRSMR